MLLRAVPILLCALQFSTSASVVLAERPDVSPVDAQSKLDRHREFFETKIRPLLVAKCIECHGEQSQEGKLRLDSQSGWQIGGESGPAIKPGDTEASLLLQAIRYTDKDLKMPPDQPLTAEEIASLTEWIREGAVDTRQFVTATLPSTDTWAVEFDKRLDWWSLKELRSPPIPASPVIDARSPVDSFLNESLRAADLQPAPPAEPEVLLRRLAIVLTGLPPDPEDRSNFLQAWAIDPSTAYAALVDRLINSPHFGEHFARHWMDAVRYTDTYGYEWDIPAKGSFEYRDYLIRAFNSDVGFDVFLREQLAGDLLPEPRIDTALAVNESLIGPMFYHMGEHRHGSSLAYNGVHQEMVTNKIDAFSKVFLAMTVACAKCHDHKLEAVSQKDYYALGAAFMTPRWASRPIDAPEKHVEAIAKLVKLRADIRSELAQLWKSSSLESIDWRSAIQKSAEKSAEKSAVPEPTIESIAYPLIKLAKADTEVSSVWNALASEWTAARSARIQANAAFQNLAEFDRPELPKGWVTDGDGMRYGWVADATPLIALEGQSIVARLLAQGYHTNALSSKLPGALRMPAQDQVPGTMVSLCLAGGQFGGYLQLDQNAFLNEAVQKIERDQPAWQTFGDAALKGGVTKVTIDFVTCSLNPNFPPRTGLIPGLANEDTGYDKRSWLSITGIASHDAAGTPQDSLDAFTSLYAGPAPESGEQLQARVAAWFEGAVRRWCDDTGGPGTVETGTGETGSVEKGDRQLLQWLLDQNLLPNAAAAGTRLAALQSEYRQVEQSISFPRSINTMDERGLERQGLHLNVRGNYDALGEVVMPDSLQLFAGRNEVAGSAGSGRLELAQSLLRRDHPLTARVYVNRIWQWVFGTGLVTTPDDFGRLGDRPSHPDLLDWLAQDLMQHQWSTKHAVRQLVMSDAFRRSGVMTDEARQRDPGNRLRHHYPTQRMEAESIRDAMLMISGRWDAQLYGHSINPSRPAEDAAKRLFSGPLEGDGRRSLYLTMSIMAPPKFLTTFDLPDVRLPSGRRNVTSVPTQALLMMNDPLVLSLAQRWAQALIQTDHAAPQQRIDAMFIAAFGRTASAVEQQRWTGWLGQLPVSGTLMDDEPAWTQLAHALFNSQEFIYYR